MRRLKTATARAQIVHDVDLKDGKFALEGEKPVNPSGGLKSFGHPVGASGLRMMFEAWLQLRNEALQQGLKGRSAMNKAQLEAALSPSRGAHDGNNA